MMFVFSNLLVRVQKMAFILKPNGLVSDQFLTLDGAQTKKFTKNVIRVSSNIVRPVAHFCWRGRKLEGHTVDLHCAPIRHADLRKISTCF